ncbi:outer membrane beta-barrel protein [candidate division KSB1 bacterium]|nr:outer membrane beta-barrel protein [candidate division KSB1 bacterium]
MKTRITTLAAILILLPVFVWAQTAGGGLTLSGGISLPMGDFGDDKQNDGAPRAGFAKTGFGLGLEYAKPLNSPGLAWVSGVSVIMNSLDTDKLADGDEDEIDAGSWINVPVMTGLRYASEVSPGTFFYGIGQVGLNMIMAPDLTIEDMEVDMGSATTFGFALGGGVILNDKINIGLKYYILGESTIDGEIMEDDDAEDVEWETPVSMVFLTVGLRLGGN